MTQLVPTLHQGVHGFVAHLSREPPKVTFIKIIIKLYPLTNESQIIKSIRSLYYMFLILEIIIRIFKFSIILKLLTLSDILVFSVKVGHETVHPLVLSLNFTPPTEVHYQQKSPSFPIHERW
jgi:hypothetical protein